MTHADRPNPETLVLESGKAAATVEDVLEAIVELGFEHETISHEPLYTVEEAKRVKYNLVGAHTKNLFLRNKKGRMFLFVVEHDQMINLKELRDRLQMPGGQFAFASTERLEKYLGVVPGSVSPLAVINDETVAVQVYIQDSLLTHEYIYLHPCRNTHSSRLKTQDLLKILEAWQHPATTISFT